MEITVVDHYEDMSRAAANHVIGLLKERPHSAVGLTTGNTPMGLYGLLAEYAEEQGNLFGAARIFLTEEYVGVGPDDRRSLYAWLRRAFLEPCGIQREQVVRNAGEAADPLSACAAYEEELTRVGGFDLLVEGIGVNGHIGFNEPGSPPDSRTRVVSLDRDTQDYNERYWNEKVPEYGMTIGLANVLETRCILLLASGEAKAEALAQALEGPVTPEVPCSYLQMAPHVMVIADRSAAALLKSRARA